MTPVISSIISHDFLSKYVADHYDFDEIPTCKMLKTGINHSYLIANAQEKFVFRVYYINWRSQVEIEEELWFLNYLKANDITISYPIKDLQGNFIQSINAPEGKRFAVLFSYAEGQTLRQFSNTTCFHLGKMMAKIHQFTINKTLKRTNYNAEILVSWAYHMVQNHFSTVNDDVLFFKKATDRVVTAFEKATTKNIRYGIVHLDIGQHNINVKNETGITLFDFDNCGNGWLFLDIGFTLMMLFRNEPNKEVFLQRREHFFNGYETITPISIEEKELIPFGGLAIWLYYSGIHVQRFDDFGNPFFGEYFLNLWLKSVDQWMQFNDINI